MNHSIDPLRIMSKRKLVPEPVSARCCVSKIQFVIKAMYVGQSTCVTMDISSFNPAVGA